MSRFIGILALLLAGAPLGRSQTATDWQREIATRYLDWTQSNTVLFEAVQRLAPCSPRLSSLLVQVRENAAALVQANRQYFDQSGPSLRKENAAVSKLAAETGAALGDLKSLDLDTARAVELSQELRKGLNQKQTLLQEIAAGVAAESKLWTAYYDAFEAAIRRQCLESQPGGAKPPPAAAPRKRR